MREFGLPLLSLESRCSPLAFFPAHAISRRVGRTGQAVTRGPWGVLVWRASLSPSRAAVASASMPAVYSILHAFVFSTVNRCRSGDRFGFRKCAGKHCVRRFRPSYTCDLCAVDQKAPSSSLSNGSTIPKTTSLHTPISSAQILRSQSFTAPQYH